jgi:EAL domain-containing protein (putative c-di-GMP-specific phosphodiesterase class I)
VIDDDSQITEALSMALETAGRTVIVCADVESAELALERFPVTDIVTDVQFSGVFGFEGLHFLERIRARLPGGRIVVMTGYGTDALRAAAAGYGVTAVLAKPFALAELERILDVDVDVSTELPFELIRIPGVDTILTDGILSTAFQPILSAKDEGAHPFAFEALARVSGGWPAGGAAELFAYAARKSRSVELNRAALVNAIGAASALPASSLLFLNVDPPTFSDRRLVDDVLRSAEHAGISPLRIVLEITERVSLNGDAASGNAFEALRAKGVRFALDDHGSAYSHLADIASIRPSFIKISNIFGTGFETDLAKQRVIRNVVALAKDFGCQAVLEGIESQATAEAARKFGIDLVQGYFFSVPRDVSYWKVAA